MRLSEAIRLGAMMRPQAFNNAYKDGATCALGAALEAAGYVTYHATGCVLNKESERWSVMDVRVGCPVCRPDQRPFDVGVESTIVHLNDHHHWTREAIADWVETVEAQQAVNPINTPQEVAV